MRFAAVFSCLAALATGAHAEATCYGTVDNGRIDGAVALPREGPNFVRLTQGPVTATRVYVHPLVKDVVVDAYAALAIERPSIRWVYGETGLERGGPLPPHKTHQNGTSVDLFVPVTDRAGNSVAFPNKPDNGFGYQVHFDAKGQNPALAIDYANLAELLYALHESAKRKGSGIALVIFQRELRPYLFQTARGQWLKENIPFPNWDDSERHDAHIHVNFTAACK